MTHQQYCIFDDVSTKRVGSLSMATPHWLDERQARAWRVYLKLNQELYAALEVQLQRDSGLSGADYTVLVPLSTASDGVLRTRELGTEIGWDRSRLSHQISRMERRGLVAREECSEDGRGSMVRLTDAGRSAIEGAARACRDRPSLLLRSPVGRGARHTHCGLRTSPRRVWRDPACDCDATGPARHRGQRCTWADSFTAAAARSARTTRSRWTNRTTTAMTTRTAAT